jgi:hypothetical protein
LSVRSLREPPSSGGFTSVRAGTERRVVLDAPREPLSLPPESPMPVEIAPEVRTLSGVLKYADSTKIRHGQIEIVEHSGRIHKIQVPLSMMADIVRPLFELSVMARVRKQGKALLLEDIQSIDDEEESS